MFCDKCYVQGHILLLYISGKITFSILWVKMTQWRMGFGNHHLVQDWWQEELWLLRSHPGRERTLRVTTSECMLERGHETGKCQPWVLEKDASFANERRVLGMLWKLILFLRTFFCCCLFVLPHGVWAICWLPGLGQVSTSTLIHCTPRSEWIV